MHDILREIFKLKRTGEFGELMRKGLSHDKTGFQSADEF
jgi:hypothetical protein